MFHLCIPSTWHFYKIISKDMGSNTFLFFGCLWTWERDFHPVTAWKVGAELRCAFQTLIVVVKPFPSVQWLPQHVTRPSSETRQNPLSTPTWMVWILPFLCRTPRGCQSDRGGNSLCHTDTHCADFTTWRRSRGKPLVIPLLLTMTPLGSGDFELYRSVW